jgi:hypothetical protein
VAARSPDLPHPVGVATTLSSYVERVFTTSMHLSCFA